MVAAIVAVDVFGERTTGTDLSAEMESRAILPLFSSSVTTATFPIVMLSPTRRSIFSKSSVPSCYAAR